MLAHQLNFLVKSWGQSMKVVVSFTLLFFLTVSLLKAQSPVRKVPDISDSLAVINWLKEERVPCLAVGYIENGRVQTIKIFGELKMGIQAPLNTVFNIASITKTITTMVTLNVVNSGSWNLDEPVSNYFTDPDVKDDARSQQITTRDILTHRSGFPNWRIELPTGKLAFQFDPGTRYQYSGEGFEYLRHALENKFGKPLDKLADSIIFKPLEMNNTSFKWNIADEGRFAYPFDASKMPVDIVRNTVPNAADLLKTTISDYCKFILWMLDGGGLQKDLLREMVSHQVERKANTYMGLGWIIYDPVGNAEYALSHGGHDPGVHTIAIMLPQSKRGLVIFTNSDNGIKLYPALLDHYLGAPGRSIVAIETKKAS